MLQESELRCTDAAKPKEGVRNTRQTETILYIIVPCYNEEEVLALTAPLLMSKLCDLIRAQLVSPESRILFVDDGSKDSTWDIIKGLACADIHYAGIRLSRNRGQQHALLAGLMECKDICDITISIDCDGQDDMNAMDRMVRAFHEGAEIVYGVRSDRSVDSAFKRHTAQSYYKFMNAMGVELIYNHADFRLVSSRVLQHFADFHEVNLFLRGMFPLVGFKSTAVSYERRRRLAGKTHYSLSKMLSLAFDGITSLSVRPLHLISILGICITLFGFAGIIWAIVEHLRGQSVAGWASIVCVICFFGGTQLLCLGVIGEYIGKIYRETKHRPRFIISEKTDEVADGTEGA